MRQYSRAQQRRLDYRCITEHTIAEYEEDRIQTRRSNKRKTFWSDPKDDDRTGADSRRSGRSHGNCSDEFEPRAVRKKRRESRIPLEDGRAHEPRCGTESATEEVGEAA